MNRPLSLTIGSLAIVAGLAWVNLQWLEARLDVSPIKLRAASLLDEPSLGDGAESRPASGLGIALAKPIFHSDRRPFVLPALAVAEALVVEDIPATAEDASETILAPSFRLAGIGRFDGKARALLGDETSEEVRWYGEGDELQGWMIASIGTVAVTLTAGDNLVSVQLYPKMSDGLAQ